MAVLEPLKVTIQNIDKVLQPFFFMSATFIYSKLELKNSVENWNLGNIEKNSELVMSKACNKKLKIPRWLEVPSQLVLLTGVQYILCNES